MSLPGPGSPHGGPLTVHRLPSQPPVSPHNSPQSPSQPLVSPHNPQSPLTTLLSQPPMSPHNAPLTAPGVPPVLPRPSACPQDPNNLLSSTPASPSCPSPSKKLAPRLSTSPLAFREAFLPRDVTAAGGRWQISTEAEPGRCLISGLGTASSCCPGCCWCVFMCHKQPRA